MLITAISLQINTTNSFNDNVVIIVTTKSLYEDVKELVCSDDKVDVLTAGNIDPHHYSLSPEDIDKVKKSDLVITTGHMDFELKIREMIKHDEIRVELVDPMLIEGIVIKNIPGTRVANLHGVTYDPNNYKLFITEIYQKLVLLNPKDFNCYREKYNYIVREIDNLLYYRDRFKLKALADSPLVQYAVEWLGIEITDVVIKEHDLPVDPRSVVNAEEMMKNKNIDVVIINYPIETEASEWLNEKANEYGVPILYVYNHNYGEKTLSKLSRVIDFLTNKTWMQRNVYEQNNSNNKLLILSVALLIAVVAPIALTVSMRRFRF